MICKIAGQKIGVLMRLRNLIPTNAKLMLFKTAILPHLTYCHLVWHFCRASDSRKIERMQERGLRAVFRNNVSYPGLLKRAELPSLQNRAQLFEGRLALTLKRGLNFNTGFFFFCSKAFSRIIFCILFRVSSHQIVDNLLTSSLWRTDIIVCCKLNKPSRLYGGGGGGAGVIEDLRYSLKILMIFVFGLAVTLYIPSAPAFHH